MKISNKNVYVVHEWFVNYAGSEKVVEQFLNVFPESTLCALIEFLPESLKWFIKNKKVNTSFLQIIPGIAKHYRNFLPLMPLAVRSLDVSKADIIISSSHAVSKGVKTRKDQLHVCYCHTPMRYAWDLTEEYLKNSKLEKGLKGKLIKFILERIRRWDLKSADNVTFFIANSNYVAARIKNIYKRDAAVIYPPVATHEFELREDKEDFYVAVSRMVSYKKIDLVVEAFTNMPGKKLYVIGTGPDLRKIQSKAGKNVVLLGHQPLGVLKDYMQRAKAFVFAADEDFGITTVEAQACGTPVIAYRKGGSLETVREGRTGIYFDEQTVESITKAVMRFEEIKGQFDPKLIRDHAETFNEERFRNEILSFVEEKYSEFKSPQKADAVVA
ncbi:MAG: glycosyltransferase [Cytophagaceae bacterium]